VPCCLPCCLLQERGKFQAETRSNVGGMSKRSSLKK
jgi:hypothetical protein